jgi:hypothetical protein
VRIQFIYRNSIPIVNLADLPSDGNFVSEPKSNDLRAGNIEQRTPSVTSGLSDTTRSDPESEYNKHSNNGNKNSFNLNTPKSDVDYNFNPSLGTTPRLVHNSHSYNKNTDSFNTYQSDVGYNSENIVNIDRVRNNPDYSLRKTSNYDSNNENVGSFNTNRSNVGYNSHLRQLVAKNYHSNNGNVGSFNVGSQLWPNFGK